MRGIAFREILHRSMNVAKQTMYVLMAPNWRDTNPYLDLLARELEAFRIKVILSDIPTGPFALTRLRIAHPLTRILHLHWPDPLFVPVTWSRRGWRRSIRRILFKFDVIFSRALGFRLIWTIHNAASHESPDREEEVRLSRFLARIAHKTIVHSRGALETLRSSYGEHCLPPSKAVVIRHGNYAGCYPPNNEKTTELRKLWRLNPSDLVILFFGQVRPYKGLETLIGAFRKATRADLRLVIAGNPRTNEIQKTLETATTVDPRIHLALERIPDADVAAYLDVADVVAIPFENTLTSGSSMLAMTHGKALILPASARMLDLGNNDSAIFFEQIDDLAKRIQQLNKAILRDMGARNHRLAEQLSWNTIAAETFRAYLT